MIAMRNLVIHQYDGIDLQVVWDTVNQDLPQLITSLEEITKAARRSRETSSPGPPFFGPRGSREDM